MEAIQYFYLILLLLIGGVIPLLSALSSGEAKKLLTESPEQKVSVYIQSFVVLWLSLFFVLVAFWYYGDDLANIGLVFLDRPFSLPGLLAISLTSLWVFRRVNPGPRSLDWLRKQYREVSFLLPKNKREYHWMVLLSFTAGICEEILFRGFIFWQFSGWMSVPLAIFLANVLFAFAHFATGLKNAVAVFVLGVVWSMVFLATGSLWWPILTHIIVDLFAAAMSLKMYTNEEQV